MNPTEDNLWMEVALSEGRKGIGLTAPNPPVGAVIVRDGREIARGWHQQVGCDHAEKAALRNLNEDEARGGTIYVTLEPCSTPGRTGACTSAIIEAGLARVVYGAPDPNPAHEGGADLILQKAGIAVESGCRLEECQHLIRAFTMTQCSERPWVIAKTAMSLDGKISRPNGEGQWLTSKEARERVQELRSEVDAIVTSGETVRKDNPALNLRGSVLKRRSTQPKRVILTNKKLDEDKYQVFDQQTGGKTIVHCGSSLEDSLQRLWKEEQIQTVLVEAGGQLLGRLLDDGLIDEFVIYLAPLVCGGETIALGGTGIASLEDSISLQNIQYQQVGSDLILRGLVKSGVSISRR